MTSKEQDTRWSMVRSASNGDESARTQFASVYAGTVRAFLEARWLGSPMRHEADDATQEVLLECLKPGGVLERSDQSRGDFRGLLFGVTRNVARRFEERAVFRRRQRPEDSRWMEQLAADEPGQATLFDRGWARTLVKQAKHRQRLRASRGDEAARRRVELLEQRFGDNESIRRIAARWQVPAQDVHNAYRQARIEFYRCLREVVATVSPPGADLDSECRRLLSLLK